MAAGALRVVAGDGPADDGAAFPNECQHPCKRAATVGAVRPVRLRYLPTEANLAAARARGGDRCAGLLDAWRETWRAAVGDVEAYAARMAPWLSVPGPETPEEAGHVDPTDGPAFIRPASFHVLEDASTLMAALRSGVPFAVLVPRKSGGRSPDTFVRREGVRRLRLVDEPSLAHFVGQAFAETDCATPYWREAAFREAAGRPMGTCAGSSLPELLAEMASQGHSRAFVKALRAKEGTWVVRIPSGGPRMVAAALDRAMGEAWRPVDGNRQDVGFLVQGLVPFVAEHRFFVVGHRVVASTASDRMLGAHDVTAGRILDPRVARLERPASGEGYYDRGASPASGDRPLVARMALGARSLARGLGKGGFGIDCYVVDMGLTESGDVLPIEVNGISSSGQYAVDAGRVFSALARRERRTDGDGLRDSLREVDCERERPALVDPVEVERIAWRTYRRQLGGLTGMIAQRMGMLTMDGIAVGSVRMARDAREGRRGRHAEDTRDYGPAPPQGDALRTHPRTARAWRRALAKVAWQVCRDTANDLAHASDGRRVEVEAVCHRDGPDPAGGIPGHPFGTEWELAKVGYEDIGAPPGMVAYRGWVDVSGIDLDATLPHPGGWSSPVAVVLRDGATVGPIVVRQGIDDTLSVSPVGGTIACEASRTWKPEVGPDLRAEWVQAALAEWKGPRRAVAWEMFCGEQASAVARELGWDGGAPGSWMAARDRVEVLFGAWLEESAATLADGVSLNLSGMYVDPLGQASVRLRLGDETRSAVVRAADIDAGAMYALALSEGGGMEAGTVRLHDDGSIEGIECACVLAPGAVPLWINETEDEEGDDG